MNITSTRSQQPVKAQGPAPQQPPKQTQPQETFTSRTSDVYEEIVPIYSSVTAAMGGLEFGQSLGTAVGGEVGRVVGGALGFIGWVYGGGYIGREAVSFYGEVGASLDSGNPERGKAIAQAATAGLFGVAFGGGLGSAAFMVGAGVGVAGLETLIARARKE